MAKAMIRTRCPMCKTEHRRPATCRDCHHSFENPFDQLICEQGKSGARLCSSFKLGSTSKEVLAAPTTELLIELALPAIEASASLHALGMSVALAEPGDLPEGMGDAMVRAGLKIQRALRAQGAQTSWTLPNGAAIRALPGPGAVAGKTAPKQSDARITDKS